MADEKKAAPAATQKDTGVTRAEFDALKEVVEQLQSSLEGFSSGASPAIHSGATAAAESFSRDEKGGLVVRK